VFVTFGKCFQVVAVYISCFVLFPFYSGDDLEMELTPVPCQSLVSQCHSSTDQEETGEKSQRLLSFIAS
jgi:hypothetical protein